uniref:Uncharacterized protein n=1 Tax=Anguilla anguilla TaxID=7936 RepID=A0A0E9XV01_ANGAN
MTGDIVIHPPYGVTRALTSYFSIRQR